MIRIITPTLIWLGMALAASPALAQGSGQIPIEQDLRRERANRREIEARTPPRFDGTARPTNPSGVPGFDGPPGIIGDSVGSYAPLPPGAPGNED